MKYLSLLVILLLAFTANADEGEQNILVNLDDVIAAGSVLTQLPALIEAGAKAPVYLAITHPVLLSTAVEWLDSDLIAELVVIDTIHVPQEHRHPKLRILSVAPLLAQAIRCIHGGESIGPLVEGTWQTG